MPLTPLREVLNQRSGFTQQVKQLQGFAQSIRQSQARKQQMLEKVASEKELIQFRSDVQLEQKKQFYEDVTKPKLQAEQELKQQQQWVEQFNQSKEDAQKTIKELSGKLTNEQYGSLTKYNLDKFNFGIEGVEQNGRLVGAKAQIYYNGEKLPSRTSYYKMLGHLSDFGDMLKSVENTDEKLETKIKNDGTIKLGNDDEGKDIINRIKNNPDEAYKYFLKFEKGGIDPVSGSPDGGEQTRHSTLDTVVPKVIGLRDSLSKKGERTYAVSDQDITDDWSIGGIFEDTENRRFSVNFNTSFSSVQAQMNEVAEMTLDLPKDKSFNIGSLSEEEQKMIITGNATDEKLKGVPSERAKYVRKLANLNDDTRQELQKLFKDYNTYNTIWDRVVGETGLTYSKDDYILDINNVPDDISQINEFKRLLKPIEEWENAGRLIEQGAKYWRDVQPTNQLVN